MVYHPYLRRLGSLTIYKCPYEDVSFSTVILRPSRYKRNRNDLAIPLFRRVSGQRSFAYRLVKIWNDLKSPLKSSTSVATFKKKLRDNIQSADIVI